MKHLLNILVILVTWSLFYMLCGFVLSVAHLQQYQAHLFGITVSLVFISLVYKQQWFKKLLSNKTGKYKIAFLFTAATLAAAYPFSLFTRSNQLFKYLVSTQKRGWEGNAHVGDSLYGFRPLKNARAFHVFEYGEAIPMAYNREGFRVPLKDTLQANIPGAVDLLFLGCSYTYGDACYAENTFPYLVAEQLQGTYINAGVCSYGLAQMYLLAKELIPKYKPRYVVFQYSPWLTERSVSMFAPVYHGTLPTPYFIKNDTGFNIQKPLYKTNYFELDALQVRSEYKNNTLPFVLNRGAAFYLKQDINNLTAKLGLLAGRLPKPAAGNEALTKYVYEAFIQIARENNAQPIVLNVGGHNTFAEFDTALLQAFKGAYLADAVLLQRAYLAKNKMTDPAYAFTHWKIIGNDTVITDTHPNNTAHKIIAQAITNTVQK